MYRLMATSKPNKTDQFPDYRKVKNHKLKDIFLAKTKIFFLADQFCGNNFLPFCSNFSRLRCIYTGMFFLTYCLGKLTDCLSKMFDMLYFFAIFIFHSRESELYSYIFDRMSALAWELLFPRCLDHLSLT